MVKTHKDYLIENHGLSPQHNPTVHCACGCTTSADTCVDLVPLPMRIRKALGLDKVDFICGGCQSRLFVNRHIAEDEFYGLLGADMDALFIHNARDREHQQGVDLRDDAHKPRHERVSEGKLRQYVNDSTVPTTAPIPLQEKEASHGRQAQWLAYRYALTNVIQPPDKATAVDLAPPEA